MNLSELKNTHRKNARRKVVGRGPGSNKGKTSCRGHKGDKSRSGYKRRHGKEGGQLPLFQKVPIRGFTRGRHVKPVFTLNLSRIESMYEDGETVSRATLQEKGYNLRRFTGGIKILADGELSKKVTIEANAFSKSTVEKLEKNNIEFKKVPLTQAL